MDRSISSNTFTEKQIDDLTKIVEFFARRTFTRNEIFRIFARFSRTRFFRNFKSGSIDAHTFIQNMIGNSSLRRTNPNTITVSTSTTSSVHTMTVEDPQRKSSVGTLTMTYTPFLSSSNDTLLNTLSGYVIRGDASFNNYGAGMYGIYRPHYSYGWLEYVDPIAYYQPSIIYGGYLSAQLENVDHASGCIYKSFNFDADNFQSILPSLLSDECDEISFTTNYSGQKYAFGSGANKCAYAFINNDILNTGILIKTRRQFVNVNIKHEFWEFEANIKAFCKYLKMMVNSGCLFEYHFEPCLLEKLTDSKLSDIEIKSYAQLICGETFAQIEKLNSRHLMDLTGHSLKIDYYKDLVMQTCSIKSQIYEDLATYFIAYFDKLTVSEADSKISGSYNFTPEIVSGMCTISPPYNKLWIEFIKSLSESELKQLLVRFGSSTSVETQYQIIVCPDIRVDISIRICSAEVLINKRLFDQNCLSNLKMYLIGDEKISD
jgi:hypothetical protein